ncbi:MAG: alpha/beta fold hydrolase [Flavobacteriales bacterium]|nr:alpha/beta fold hydrolase [Flavobacteriales bacterium]
MTKIRNSWFVGSNSRKSAITLYLNESSKKQALVVFVHGFKGFKDWGHFPMICERIAEKGIAVLAFNFTHNGGTVNNPIDFPDLEAFSRNTYSKEVDDVGHVFNWIVAHQQEYFDSVDLNNISILGHSRGGSFALLASNRFPQIKKVVTWAAVADFEERLPSKEKLEKWEESGVYVVKNGRTKQDMPMNFGFVEDLMAHVIELKIENALRELKKPILLIHGKEDEAVHYDDAKRIQQWNMSNILLGIEQCNHTFNGKHPWTEKELPKATMQAIEATVEHLLC